MSRLVQECPFREVEGQERATCKLLDRRLPPDNRKILVPRSVCQWCCNSMSPGPDRLNEVIASLLYRATRRICNPAETSAEEAAALAEAHREAEDALRIAWQTPNHPGWTGPVPSLPATAELIDAAVSPLTFAEHLARQEPFSYVRYGDGEWLSILGQRGRNADGHDFFPDTMGRELDASLEEIASLWPENGLIYTGLHAAWYQDAIRRYLDEHAIARRIHWVGDQLFLHGLANLSTRRVLEAVQWYDGLKMLVGNPRLAPLARVLGCRHVIIPQSDCYLSIDSMVDDCRFSGPGLLLCCAGMASECLVRRIRKENIEGTYMDCGHVFDGLVGTLSRDYARAGGARFLEFLAEHYEPFTFNKGLELGGPA